MFHGKIRAEPDQQKGIRDLPERADIAGKTAGPVRDIRCFLPESFGNLRKLSN